MHAETHMYARSTHAHHMLKRCSKTLHVGAKIMLAEERIEKLRKKEEEARKKDEEKLAKQAEARKKDEEKSAKQAEARKKDEEKVAKVAKEPKQVCMHACMFLHDVLTAYILVYMNLDDS